MPSPAVSGRKTASPDVDPSSSVVVCIERIIGLETGDSGGMLMRQSGRRCVVVLVQCRGFLSIDHAWTRLFDHQENPPPPFCSSSVHSSVYPPGSLPIFFLCPFQLTFEATTSPSLSSSPNIDRYRNGKLVSVCSIHRVVECPYQSREIKFGNSLFLLHRMTQTVSSEVLTAETGVWLANQ